MKRIAVFDLPPPLSAALSGRLRGALLQEYSPLIEIDTIVVCSSAQVQLLSPQKKRLFLIADDSLCLANVNSESTIVNPDRFLPKHQLIRQQLDAGKLGEPGLLRLHRWEPTPNRLRDLDLVLWYFGQAPNTVHAVANDVCTQIHLGFPNGGMALLDHARASSDTYYSVSLIGAHGAAYADDHANAQLVYQAGQTRAIRADEAILQWTAMLQAIVTACDLGQPICSEAFPRWRDVLAVNDAIEQSLRGGQS